MILQQVLLDYTHSYVVHTYVYYKYMPDIQYRYIGKGIVYTFIELLMTIHRSSSC